MDTEEFVLHGPKSLPTLMNGTVGQQMYHILAGHAHLPEAMIDVQANQALSYKTLFEETCKLAQSLQRCGYKQNDVISVCSENSVYFFQPIISALYLGIIVAPFNDGYIEEELYNTVNTSQPQLIFCSEKALLKITQLKQKCSFIKKIIILDAQEDVEENEGLQNFILRNSDENYKNFRPLDFDPVEQVAAVLCSSGTTGLPKGVMVTHMNLAVRFAHSRDPKFGTQARAGSSVLTFMPFFHGFGFCTTLEFLLMGNRVILLKRFVPELYLRLIQDYKVYSLLLVPAVMLFLAKSPLVDKYNLSSIKEIIYGSAPLSSEIENAVAKRLNFNEIRQAYGLTESTLAVTMRFADGHKNNSSGILVPLMSAKVVDIENKKSLGPNSVGELCFKGPMVMKGYIGNIKATQETIDSNGWVHTGDLGYYDKDGHFYVLDRLKELIKYKGFQVAPAELEALLLKHPSIKDAGVIGVPDEKAGELPAAFIVKQPGKEITAEEVVDYIANRVSSAKHLRGGVWFIDEIPKSSTAKIVRKELKNLALKMKSKL